jgi:hypothetical protein
VYKDEEKYSRYPRLEDLEVGTYFKFVIKDDFFPGLCVTIATELGGFVAVDGPTDINEITRNRGYRYKIVQVYDVTLLPTKAIE